MPELVATLFSALPAPAAEPPEWVHLVPAGTFRGADGRGPYTLADSPAVIAASMAGGKIAIDENHSIDLAGRDGRPSPARGWITALEARDDGLWGRVEWTESGRALLADRAYRGLSPAIVSMRDTGRVVKLLRASLTNDPNLNLTTLHQRSTDMWAKLRAALGLAADADEAAILAAATAAQTAIATHSAERKRIAKAAGLDATAAQNATADVVVTHLQARSTDLARIAEAAGLDASAAKSATADVVVKHLQTRGTDTDKLAKTVIELQTKLDTMDADRAKERATRAIDAAIAGGKPIKPLRDHYIERHVKDPDGVAKELAGMVSLHDGGARRGASTEPGADGLSETDREVCALMGLDPKAYGEQLKAHNEEIAR